jgi:hypothetical protein
MIIVLASNNNRTFRNQSQARFDTKRMMIYDKSDMSAKRTAVLIIITLVLGTLLFPQSLAEIAQKERERRASIKGKKAAVITNADLAKLKKKPALETPQAQPATEAGETRAVEPSPAPLAEPERLNQAPPPAGPQAELPPAGLKELQARWERAQEYVELLTLKMGALWQEFYSLGDMAPKEAIRLAISETFIKLQTAQEVETAARQELEKFISEQKKESLPSIWIR